MEIRRAEAADAGTIVGLWDRFGGPTRTPGGSVELARLLQRDPDSLLVAVIDDRIVGTLIVGWDGWRCHLYRLAVEPDFRRRGVARELAAAALERARQLGAARLDASVDPSNESAVHFWESVGYSIDHDRRWSITT